MRLSDHKRIDDWCKCIKAATRTKMTAVCLLLFCRCRATYSTGLVLKTGDCRDKTLRAEVWSRSDCASSPSPWPWRRALNDRPSKSPGPQTYRRTTAGLWVFDHASDSSPQESVCQICRVYIKYWFSQISLGHLPSNEIPFEQRTSSVISGRRSFRWEVKHPRPTQKGEINTQTPYRTARWGFRH